MSDAEAAGQLIFVGLAGNQVGAAERNAIAVYRAGGVWYTNPSSAALTDVRTVSDGAQQIGGGRLFVSANQEGGRIDTFTGQGFTLIPSALAQGGLDPATLRVEAATWGRELKAAGINLNLAPVMDTVPPGGDASNQPIGVLQREFGHDPGTVSSHGVAFIEGMHEGGEATTVKHFPGLGRVGGNTDLAADIVDTQTTATDPYLQPFRSGIAAGTDMVMISTATYTRIDPNHIAAFSSGVVTDLLRNQIGYQGVVVSDDLGAAVSVAGIDPGTRAVDFVLAGGDLITVKFASLVPAMTAALTGRMASDPAFRERVRASSLRVLELKQRMALLSC